MKRLAIYQKGNQKPVIITDSRSDQTKEQLVEECKKVFSSKNVFTLDTGTDCFIGRPSEIQSILISEDRRGDSKGHDSSTN